MDNGLPDLSTREHIGRLMLRLFIAYRKKADLATVDVYHEALRDLMPRESELAFLEATRRYKYFPNPAEIREALYVALERNPRGPESDPACARCDGQGWETIEKDGRAFAAPCRCRIPKEL